MGGHALKRSFPFRAGAAVLAIAAMVGALAAAKLEMAKPEQIADAQAQIKINGLACDAGKVRFGGEGDMKSKDGKSVVHVLIYEATCSGTYGYIIEGPKGGSPTVTVVSSCPALAKTAAAAKKEDAAKMIVCQLPENLDLKAQTQALMDKTNAKCAVQGVRWIGMNNKTAEEGLEVSCAAPSPGYILFIAQKGGSAPRAINCLVQGVKCELTPEAQQTAWVAGLAAQSGKACDVTGKRYVGTDSKDMSSFFEVSCAKGIGFMIQMNANNQFERVIECADATNLGGGCKLTDPKLIQASSNSTYGDRLKGIGVACNVVNARLIGQTTGKRDVVEYQCTDRPGGLIVAFPNGAGQKPDVVDCFDSHHFSTNCQFTSHDDQINILNKAMAAGGKTCKVSDFLNLGGYDDGTTAFEIACGADPGYIVMMPADYSAPKKTETCPEAAKTASRTGLSCTLPGNH